MAYWHMGDESRDGAIIDLVNGIAFTIAQGPLQYQGQSSPHHGGMAVGFNVDALGLHQNATAPNGVQSYPFSMSGWFCHVAGVVTIGNVSINGSSIWDGWYLTADTSAGWKFNTASNTSFATGAVGAATRSLAWDHVVCVAESATKRTIYVNGVQGTVDTSNFTPARSDHQFRVGSDGLGSNWWGGYTDSLRFYSRALTPEDVLQLYAEPYAGLAPRRTYQFMAAPITNVNLTGQAMTAGQGAVTPTRNINISLSGLAMTAGQGAVDVRPFRGYTFRRTLAGRNFPGDPPNCTWADVNQVYSPSATGGSGVGYAFNPGGLTQDFLSPVNGYYGGDYENNGGGNYWRVDVPKGPVDVRLLLGGNNTIRFRYGPGSTPGTDYSDISGSTYNGDNVHATDANGVVFSNANTWLAGNTPLRINNIAGYLQVEKSPTQSFNSIGFLSYSLVHTALVDCTFTDETGTAGAPTLYQNQVPGKLIGTIQQSIGGAPATTLAVTESDGVTPSLYLSIQYINGVPWLVQKNVQMPALGGTYNFKIIQTDVSGQNIYTNSPYVQSCAWTVVAVPTKPFNDGSFDAKISAGAFVLRKKIRDVFNQTYNPTTRLGEWLGYVSGAFDYSATVYNITQLRNQLSSYATTASGVSNKQFLIEIDTDGTSDWTTHAMSFSSGLSFYPENGNILLVRYKATGAKPVLYGGWSFSYVRGIHIDGIVFGTGIAPLADPVSGSLVYNAVHWGYFADNVNHHPIIRVTNCDIGLYFNPSYTGGRTADTIDPTQFLYGIGCQSNGNCMEQLIIKNCRFWGLHDGIEPFGCRMLRVTNCDFAMQDDDCIATECIRNEDAAYFPNFEQYEWFDNVHMRSVVPTSDGGVHADFQQTRSLANGTHPSNGMIYRLWENSSCNINFTDPSMERNVQIISDSAPVTGCWLNNIFASYALRGVDGGQGPGKSYAEYNSLPPCHMIGAGMTIQAQVIYEGYGSQLVIRNNIMGGGPYTDGYSYQGNVGYSPNNTSGVSPNTVMVGPFAADPNNASRWGSRVITDAVTYDVGTYFHDMQTAFVSNTGADAGFQTSGVLPGQSMFSSQGALALGLSVLLVGQALTAASAAPVINASPAVLSGRSMTPAQGALATSAGFPLTLPGLSATISLGAIGKQAGPVLPGQPMTATPAPLPIGFTFKISGQLMRTNHGWVIISGGTFTRLGSRDSGIGDILVPGDR